MFYCVRFSIGSMVSTEWESTGIRGTRTVPVPGNEEMRNQIYKVQRARTERFHCPSDIE